MIKIVLLVMVIALASLGLTEFIYSLRVFSLAPKFARSVSVVVLRENTAIKQLEFALFHLKWFGNSNIKCVIGITDGLSEKKLCECRDYAENSHIVLVPSEFVNNVIDSVL